MSDSLTYALVGSTPALSALELKAVWPEAEWRQVTPSIFATTQALPLEADAFCNLLGGTVKLLTHVTTCAPDEETLRTTIAASLEEASQGQSKFTYALAEHERDHLPALEPSEFKAALAGLGMRIRYLELSRHGLESAASRHTQLCELHVIPDGDELIIARTTATQDIDAWTRRDRGRPYADHQKGMLPLKVARMLVNIALGPQALNAPETATIYDPFCGTGSILSEALLAGARVEGSDTDKVAVEGTEKNLTWLQRELLADAQPFHVFTADATHVQNAQFKSLPTAIVTEPFLGKQTPKEDQLKNIRKGLEKLYTGAFRQWRTWMKDGTKVVMIFPLLSPVEPANSWGSFVDNLAALGYTSQFEPVLYHRREAKVRRAVYIFTYNR
jgi:tRNA G10  N-methylase Trm11